MSDAWPVPVHLNKALDGLALNPVLPADLVRRLLRHHAGLGQVARRADLTDDLITEILDTGQHRLVHSLALNRHLSHAFRLRLARHPDPVIRAAVVAGNQDMPPGMFELLVDDPDVHVREFLAQDERLPAHLRSRLAADPAPTVRATLARWWPEAPIEVRRALLTDPSDDVCAAACSTYYARGPHPVPPPDLIPTLLADPVTRAGVIRHVNLDQDTATRLTQDPDYAVRRQLAEHPQLPSQHRDALAADSDARVRVGVFGRPDTPEPLRAAIYSALRAAPDLAKTFFVRDVAGTVREQALRDHMASVELRTLRLDWITADPMPHVDSPYPCFRASAARSGSLPPDVVARLLADSDSTVRTTMATHAPHLVDPVTAERIDREFLPVKKTDWRPADDFALPSDTLRRLATDPNARMRCLAPRDPDLPAELAEQLATDPDSTVRRAVAGHSNLPVSVLISLLADEAEAVAQAAAGSPFLPPHQMERLLALAGL